MEFETKSALENITKGHRHLGILNDSNEIILLGEVDLVLPVLYARLVRNQPFTIIAVAIPLEYNKYTTGLYKIASRKDVINERRRIIESTSYVQNSLENWEHDPEDRVLFEGTGILFRGADSWVEKPWFSEPLYSPSVKQVLDETDKMIRATEDFHHVFLEGVSPAAAPEGSKYPDLPHYVLGMGS
jgi:hypothetical protein